MKRIGIWGIIGLLVVTGVHAQNEIYTFTDTQGREIEAMITACEYSKNKVTLERVEDKRRVTVPINMFSALDQVFIKEWYIAHELISDKNLKITCKDMTLARRKEEKIADVSSSSTGKSLGTRERSKKFETIGYEITLQNTGSLPLVKMRLEYKIYYEQSETSPRPKVKQKIYKGSIAVDDLEKGKKTMLETEGVEVYKEEISQDSNIKSSNPDIGGKGEVHGIRARLYVTLPSGKEVYREFSDPTSLSAERFPWNLEEETKGESVKI